jgi:hypothetical protein
MSGDVIAELDSLGITPTSLRSIFTSDNGVRTSEGARSRVFRLRTAESSNAICTKVASRTDERLGLNRLQPDRSIKFPLLGFSSTKLN